MSIPASPRSVRWRAALAHRWPLGLVAGIVFLIASALLAIFWLRSGWDLPFDDFALDSGAKTFEAQVTEIDAEPQPTLTEALYSVWYTFDLGDGQRFGRCYTPEPLFSQGEFCPLEYLAGDPDVHRLSGTTRSMSTVWMPDLVGYLWLPLLVILAWWFRGVLRLRYVLGNGPQAVAEILQTRNLWYINPSHLSVRYRFEDRYGEKRAGHHWVRRSSAKGVLLHAGATQMDLVYDEMRVTYSRLVVPSDFALQTGPGTP